VEVLIFSTLLFTSILVNFFFNLNNHSTPLHLFFLELVFYGYEKGEVTGLFKGVYLKC